MNHQAETGAAMVAKASPPIAVIGAQIAGIPVADWVQWITLLYVLLMLVHKAWQVGYEAYRFWILRERKKKVDE
jgi:hypothetical protein